MVYLIGASGHAKVIIEILEKREYPIGGIQDANPAIRRLLDYDVHEIFPNHFDSRNDEVIISIGSNVIRNKIASSSVFNFISAIHPATNISKRAGIGAGTAIMAGVSI